MRRLAVFLASAALAIPAHGNAQSLQYRTTTRLELSGAVGRMVSMVGGVGDPVVETTSIQGSKIRQDQDNSSEIMDWDAGTMTMLDNQADTYTRFDFAQMAHAMAGAAGQASAAKQPTGSEQQGATAQPDVTFDVKVSTDPTGKHQKIDGYDTEETILTLEIVAKETAEAAQAAGEDQPQQAGMAIVTDLWMSTDFPEQKLMEQMQGKALESFRESGADRELAGSMAGLASYDPRIEGAWQKNLEALRELKGTALRTTMHFVSLPQGVKLDRNKVLAEADKSLATDLTDAAASGAKEAAKNALSGLAGRFGRHKKEEPKKEEAPTPTQAVFMRVTSEIGDVKTAPLDPSTFEVPAGYTEVQAGSGGA